MSASLLLSLLIACGGGGTSDTGGDGGAADGGGDTGSQVVSGPLTGTWFLTMTVEPVGGLALPFQAEIVDQTIDSMHTLDFSLRATDATGSSVSDVLGEVTGVPVAADGSFELDLPVMTLPGTYSPTSGDVDVEPVLSSTGLRDDDTFCGELGGQIVTFKIDLSGSSFGARTWDQRDQGELGSCDGATGGGIDRIAPGDCPVLQAGETTTFPSAGNKRTVQIVLPGDYDAATAWPLVFAWHGLGGDATDFLDEGLREMADQAQAILIVPQAQELGGSLIWDVVTGEDNNQDLALYDDLLTCANQSFHVDPDRVYSTGMSNGGLMTGVLMSLRSDQLAAAAPLSGGMLEDAAAGSTLPPALVTWGGTSDIAYDQDFNAYALDMIAQAQAGGTFVAACDHEQGHHLEAGYWPWVFEFLHDHPRGVSPEPYLGGLPAGFPDFCTIPE